MSTAMVVPSAPVMSAQTMESLLIGGDLSKLTAEARVSYYRTVCDSLGLNPLTKPFEYINLNGKLQLYAKKDCTDQLRAKHGVSVYKMEDQEIEGIYIVTAYAQLPGGRQDCDKGAVNIASLKGESRANAIMKAGTKAKRRVTLSICGLGFLDEIETDATPGAYRVIVDNEGEIVGQDGGAKEAQAAVAAGKIAELKAQLPPSELEQQLQDSISKVLGDLVAERKGLQEIEGRYRNSRAAADAIYDAACKSAAEAEGKKKHSRKAKPPAAVSDKVLESFTAIKAEFVALLGSTDGYRQILKDYSYFSKQNIPDEETAKRVYKSMLEVIKPLRFAAGVRAEIEAMREKLGDAEWWRIVGGAGAESVALIPEDQLEQVLTEMEQAMEGGGYPD